MRRDSLLDFYREIVNSKKSFGIDYKNLSKQLIERIDKAIEYIKENKLFEFKEDESNWFEYVEDTKAKNSLLEILEGKENETN